MEDRTGYPPMLLERALDRVLKDGELLKALTEEFLDSFDQHIIGIRDALATGNADKLAREAHQLKGVAASLSMESLAEKTFTVEKAGSSGQMDLVPELIRIVELEGERVKTFISTINWSEFGA